MIRNARSKSAASDTHPHIFIDYTPDIIVLSNTWQHKNTKGLGSLKENNNDASISTAGFEETISSILLFANSAEHSPTGENFLSMDLQHLSNGPLPEIRICVVQDDKEVSDIQKLLDIVSS